MEALSVDPQLLSGHAIAAKLYHDSPDLSDAQPVLESTLDLVGQGPCTSDRMAGSQADWHTGTAKVALLCCCPALPCPGLLCLAMLDAGGRMSAMPNLLPMIACCTVRYCQSYA